MLLLFFHVWEVTLIFSSSDRNSLMNAQDKTRDFCIFHFEQHLRNAVSLWFCRWEAPVEMFTVHEKINMFELLCAFSLSTDHQKSFVSFLKCSKTGSHNKWIWTKSKLHKFDQKAVAVPPHPTNFDYRYLSKANVTRLIPNFVYWYNPDIAFWLHFGHADTSKSKLNSCVISGST